MTSASEIKVGTRDCKNCKHYVKSGNRPDIYGCESWDCRYVPKVTAEDKLERIREILEKAPNTLYFRMIGEALEDGNERSD